MNANQISQRHKQKGWILSLFFCLVWALSPLIGENAVGLSFHKSFIIEGKRFIYSIYKSMLIYVRSINPLNVLSMF